MLSREQLLGLSRLHNDEVYDRSIDIQVGRLRKKVQPTDDRPSSSVPSAARATCYDCGRDRALGVPGQARQVRLDRPSANAPLTVYGSEESGSVAVEAALTLLGIDYTLVEGATWAEPEARARVAPVNAMRQIPTLVLPDGEVLTESAAILIWLADKHPQARTRAGAARCAARAVPALDGLRVRGDLCAALDQARRAAHRRAAGAARRRRRRGARAHRVLLAHMDAQLAPRTYLLGDTLTVLDLYVTVVSRFGPWRERFYAAAPKMAPVVRRVDAEPRLEAFWARRFPFDEGWE